MRRTVTAIACLPPSKLLPSTVGGSGQRAATNGAARGKASVNATKSLVHTRIMRVPSLVALVSGGASGLGAAVCRRLAGAGAKVVVADLNGDAARALVSELGSSAVAAVTDCTSEADVIAALDLAESSFKQGPIGAAISTAGTLYAAKTVSRKGVPHPLEPFDKVMRVNVLGSFNVARLAAQRMASRVRALSHPHLAGFAPFPDLARSNVTPARRTPTSPPASEASSYRRPPLPHLTARPARLPTRRARARWWG